MTAADVQKLLEAILADYESLVKTGRTMERDRQSADLAANKRCVAAMKDWQPAARALQGQLYQLALGDDLRAALADTTKTELCVGCMKQGAMESCASVEKAVRAARRVLRAQR